MQDRAISFKIAISTAYTVRKTLLRSATNE